MQIVKQNKKYADYQSYCETYRVKIREELANNCLKIINIVKERYLPKVKEEGAKVFYLKMIEDYYRYTAESATGNQLTAVTENVLKNYNEATQATAPLKPCNSTKLGLALNLSFFTTNLRISLPRLVLLLKNFEWCQG